LHEQLPGPWLPDGEVDPCAHGRHFIATDHDPGVEKRGGTHQNRQQRERASKREERKEIVHMINGHRQRRIRVQDLLLRVEGWLQILTSS
jgi:hypothetical protein